MDQPTVRAKFTCTSITKWMSTARNPQTGVYEPRPVFNYKFQAVTSGSEENEKFFASTPSGSIELSSIREDSFELNKAYYLDFSLAEKTS